MPLRPKAIMTSGTPAEEFMQYGYVRSVGGSLEKCHVCPASLDTARKQVRVRRLAIPATTCLGFSGSTTIDVGLVKARAGSCVSLVMFVAATSFWTVWSSALKVTCL